MSIKDTVPTKHQSTTPCCSCLATNVTSEAIVDFYSGHVLLQMVRLVCTQHNSLAIIRPTQKCLELLLRCSICTAKITVYKLLYIIDVYKRQLYGRSNTQNNKCYQ